MTKLFSSGRIGSVQIRNRTVLPPMTTRYADAAGYVTDELVAYYRARAQGGVGLITVEMASPEKVGRHRAHELAIYDDCFVPGLHRLTRELHELGACVSIQLGHGGGHTRQDICGEQPIAPSAIPHFVFETTGQTIVPLEMSKVRIRQTVRAFVTAAHRAQEAGFDAVELHAAHGYLISQFLCPAENRRVDEYGGSLENRARFGLDIVRGIKREVKGLAVIFRLNADDYFPQGMRFGEALEVAKRAAAAGADAIHVTAGHYRSEPSAEVMIPPMRYPEGVFLDFAARVKGAVEVPVIAVGRLGNPALAARVLDSGLADFVALGRPLIADPDWIKRVQAGNPVRRCLACNTCVNEMRGGARLNCLVNPAVGRELEFDLTRLPRGERIAVIGAGPAGLSYASLVAGRNCVTVFERAQVPGGAFRYAGKAPRFQEVQAEAASFETFISELERDCRQQGVEIRYGVDVTTEPDRLVPFDRLIIATGASYRFGLAPFVIRLLESGWARRFPFASLFHSPRLRNWFYYRARRATGPGIVALAGAAQAVVVIGDAARAGKGKDAIASAFDAAFGRVAKVDPGKNAMAEVTEDV